MGSFHARNGTGELLARYSFLEPLLEGRRVLEIGAARATEGASALFLAERGAAAVLSIEPAEADLAGARAAGHHPFVQFQAMSPGEMRPGAFDLVLVTDGSALIANPDEAGAYRRLLAAGGRLVTALPAGGAGLPDLAGEPSAGDPPSYEAFVNALSDHFPLVEVAAQTATVGWVFGMSSQEDPEIAMDGTLAGTPDTTAYVAIAGEEPTGLSGFTVVALPVAPLLEAARARQADPAELAAVRTRAEEAEARAQQAEARTAEAEARTAEVEARAQDAAQLSQVAEETLAAERTRVSELTAALAALEVERDGALSARESASAEAEALRAEREQAIRARDAVRAEAEAALVDRDRAVEAHRQRESERETLIHERENARQRELEAQRSREVALAEAVALGESLARAEALATELSRDRDAALAARDEVMSEAGELRIALDEAKLANGSLETQLSEVRSEVARLVARAQELETGGGLGLARARELEAALQAERARAAAHAQELEAVRGAHAVAEEERQRLEAIVSEHRTGGIETEAALQAARSELQAARSALEAALDRATQAEVRSADLEDQLEKAGVPHEEHAAQLAEAAAHARRLETEVARLPELEEAAARAAELEALAARVPELEEQAARVPELELELARLSRLQEPDLRVAALEAEVVRLSGLQEAAGRVPALEAEVARLAGLTEAGGASPEEVEAGLQVAVGRVRELEEQVERLTAEAGEAEALRAEVQRLGGAGVAPFEGAPGRNKAAEELDELEAQVADAAAAREALEKKLAELKEGADRKVADARKAAYDAAAKAEAARREAEQARKELGEVQAASQGAVDQLRELAQLRETLEAHVAELNARLEAEEERTGILSAQAAEARAQLESAAERSASTDAEGRLRAAEARAEDLARQAVDAEARMRELDAVAAAGDGAAAPPAEAEAALRAELEELKAHRALLERELADARNMADVAEAQVAEIAGELQAVRWEKDEVEQKLEKATRAGAPLTGDAARLQEELQERTAELGMARREVDRLEAVVASLAIRTELPPAGDGAAELQAQLAAALQRAADAESALGAARAGASGDQAEALRKASAEHESIASQVAERDGKIARLQREVADKTERLGRLAKELGELKAKGLGKIFR
jgi:chromosome segregation ATPase